MTTFKAALMLCGLSQQEAAEYLGVSLGTIKDWSRGKSAPTYEAWHALSLLQDRIETAGIDAFKAIPPSGTDKHALNALKATGGIPPLQDGPATVAGALAVLYHFFNPNHKPHPVRKGE